MQRTGHCESEHSHCLEQESSKRSLTSNKQINDNNSSQKASNNLEETGVKTVNNLENDSECELMDGADEDEVCELFPVCQKPAYGKVVQSGECGDWYHYDCLKINETTIQTLGDDDYICRVCTDNLLTLDLENSMKENDPKGEEINIQQSETTKLSHVIPPIVNKEEESETSQTRSQNVSLNRHINSQASGKTENITKCKTKKVSKSNKMKKRSF